MSSNIRSLNRVILIGNVGRNPEITVIAGSGRDVAKFSIATSEGYFDANKQWRESTEWHNIVAWGPLAKKVEKSVAKGDLVLIEGKLKTRKWSDKISGQERSATEINADNIVVLERRNREGYSAGNGYGQQQQQGYGGQSSSGYGQGGGGYRQKREEPAAYQAPIPDDPVYSDGGSGDEFHHEEEDPF